jgi:hypothetical protein
MAVVGKMIAVFSTAAKKVKTVILKASGKMPKEISTSNVPPLTVRVPFTSN